MQHGRLQENGNTTCGHLRLPRRDHRSHVGADVYHEIRPPAAATRSTPPRSPVPRPTASKAPAARSLARRWPAAPFDCAKIAITRSTTQRSPAAASSSRKSSTASSRPRPCPTGAAARSAAGPFSRPLRWASQRTPRSRTPAYTSTSDSLAKAWPPGAQARPTAEPQPRCAHKIFTKAPPWHRHERPALVRPH